MWEEDVLLHVKLQGGMIKQLQDDWLSMLFVHDCFSSFPLECLISSGFSVCLKISLCLFPLSAQQESLIDASEDSQLEAAIRASLQETHFDSSQAKQESRSDEESESELFSGSEEFISVCGSEEEEESENPAKLRKSPHKDLGYKKEESRRPQPEPPARTEPGTTSNHRVLPCIDAGVVEEPADKPESMLQGLDVNGEWPQIGFIFFL